MNERGQSEERLTRVLGHALRDLPPRRAPLTLQPRVLSELQRRAALAWWRRSFAHWPMLARYAFVGICAVLIALTIREGAWVVAALHSMNAIGSPPWTPTSWANPSWAPPPWVQSIIALVDSLGGLANLLLRAIPPPWSYVGLGVSASFYALAFGFGAAVYRTFYLQPATRRYPQ